MKLSVSNIAWETVDMIPHLKILKENGFLPENSEIIPDIETQDHEEDNNRDIVIIGLEDDIEEYDLEKRVASINGKNNMGSLSRIFFTISNYYDEDEAVINWDRVVSRLGKFIEESNQNGRIWLRPHVQRPSSLNDIEAVYRELRIRI